MSSLETSRSVWHEDFISTCLDVDAVRYYLEEGFKPDLLPKEEARAIWHFIREYFEESRRQSVPTLDILDEEFPDFRFVEAKAEPHYLLSKLKQQWEHREAQTLARTLGQYIGDHKPERVYPYIKDKLFEMEKVLDTERNVVTIDKWDDMMDNYLAKLETGDLFGFTTGFDEIDSAMGGIKKGQLAIIAGRLKQGKTWFGLQSFIKQRYQRINPIFFTLELSTEEIWERLLALWSGISYDAISKGYVEPKQLKMIIPKVLEREKEFGPCTFIQPPPGQRQVPDLLTFVDKYKSGSMIIDQLNWLEPRRPDREYFRDDLRVADVARDLKLAAQRPGREIPVYVMHQFSRQQKKDGELLAENYGDSDKIGQIADHLFGIQQSKELREAKQIKFEIVESRSARPDAFICDFEFYEATRLGNARKDLFDGEIKDFSPEDIIKVATLLGSSSGSKQA